MDAPALPAEVDELLEVVVACLQRTYAINATRHDDLVGDDANTFGFVVYRNSWYQIEQDVADLNGWSCARPEGSLVVTGHGYSLHFYRCGAHEGIDVDQFRADDPAASLTKQHIAGENHQLVLDFEALDSPAGDQVELRSLIVIHAGNPDDGCCGIWLGAPLPNEKVLGRPWGWITPLWLIEREASDAGLGSEENPVVHHEQLAEHDVSVLPLEAHLPKSSNDKN